MKYVFPFLMLFSYNIMAQSVSEVSDKESIALLEALKADYDKYNAHRIDFTLDIELPGEGKESQTGYLIQNGDKFILEMDAQKIISDNKTVWVYLKDINEIQINDADFDDDSDFMSPSSVFNMYNSDEFIFGVSQHSFNKGKSITEIEAKPTDNYSEYSKVRITIASRTNDFLSMKFFSRDGSRYTLNVDKHIKDYPVDSNLFVLDESQYEGATIEDLRF